MATLAGVSLDGEHLASTPVQTDFGGCEATLGLPVSPGQVPLISTPAGFPLDPPDFGAGIMTITVEELIEGSDFVYRTKGKTNIYTHKGDIGDALEDFQAIESVRIIRDEEEIKIKILPDGRTVIWRTDSSDGRLTIEIQNSKGRSTDKIRYEDK